MVATFVLACAGSAGLYAVSRRTNPSHGAVLLMFAVMNFLLFSPRQYENFLYAIMGEVFAPPCALILAILVNLSNLSLKWKALVNAALAFISTYTFANGMLLWVLAFPLGTTSALRPEEARFRRFWRMAYASIGALSIFCYFISYQHPPLSPPFVSPLERLPALLHFFLFWIGSLFRVGDPALCGAVVVLLFGGLAAVAIAQGRRTGEWRAHYPWLILGCYPLISGGIVAMGRLGFGYFMAGDVRYTVSTAFFYIAVVGLGFSVYAQAKRRPLKSGIAFSAAIVFLGNSRFALGDHVQKGAPFFAYPQGRAATFAAGLAVERGDSAKPRDRFALALSGRGCRGHHSHSGRARRPSAASCEPETGRCGQRSAEHRRRLGRNFGGGEIRGGRAVIPWMGARAGSRIVRPTVLFWGSRSMENGSRFAWLKRNLEARR